MIGRSAQPYVTTMRFPRRPAWSAATRPARPTRPAALLALALVTGVPRGGTAVLNGSDRREQLVAVLLRLLRPDVHLVLADCTWKRGTHVVDRVVGRLLVRLLDSRRTRFCVLSRAEAARFPATWGVPSERVRVTEWYHGLTDEELEEPVHADGSVFAGGDSMRDYRPLIDAARAVPRPFRVGARQAPPVPREDLPPNLVFEALSEQAYRAALRQASVVVVPLAGDTERSAGQNNYLNPMALGKLVIVTDGTGVREYVEDGMTGLVVPAADAEALRAALAWVFDPDNSADVERIRAAARASARGRHGPDGYVSRLLEVAHDARAPEDRATAARAY